MALHPVADLLHAINSVADLECPEVAAEEDGDLCFDWWHAKGTTITVSLNESGRFVWAALIENWTGCGKGQLPDIASDFRSVLKRYAEVSQ